MSALQEQFAAWQQLPVFVHCSERFNRTELVIRQRRGWHSTGYAERLGRGRYRILIRCGYDSADASATLLHEMAHVAAGWLTGSIHGAKWRTLLLQATHAVTGLSFWPAILTGTCDDANAAVRQAFKAAKRRWA